MASNAGGRQGSQAQRPGTLTLPRQRAVTHIDRARQDDSWVEIASQPSSSSLSSVNDEIVTTGLRVQDPVNRRRRRVRQTGTSSALNIVHGSRNAGDNSSQEEYTESESESDRVMTSSNEGITMLPAAQVRTASDDEDDDDENRTAVNAPTHECFTPQPNAFSHPPTSRSMRNVSEPHPGSYFPSVRPVRPSTRHSFPTQEPRVQHSPYNAIAPSHNAAAHHDAALRASLSTLLSCAAAARGLPKSRQQPTTTQAPPPRPSTRIDPSTLRLVPESSLRTTSSSPSAVPEPTFHPTIRRTSTSTSASASASTSPDTRPNKEDQAQTKRKATHPRNSSKDRRALKKRRASSSTISPYNADDVFVSPTLLTWVVSAGVVVVLSALSFSAGYAVGKEAGRVESGFGASVDGMIGGDCTREAGRSGLGLRRLRFAVQA